MKQPLILYPILAMIGITAVVWLRLYFERVGEMRARRIRPQDIATKQQSTEILHKVNASDNFSNLFEVPVLFYVLCILAFTTQMVTPFLLGSAWAFVALRGLHSLIHCTYNQVMHRFAAYLLSTLLLFALWGLFAVQVLSRHT